MRTTLRAGWMLFALVATLFVSGCNTATPTAEIRRPKLSDYAIRIVKSSGNREITLQDLEQLRNQVISFLESQHLAPQDSYLVEITLPPAAVGDPGETLVVQLANVPANSYRLLASTPYATPLEDYPYYSYGYGYRSSYLPSFLYGYYDPFDSYYGSGSYPYTPRGGYVPRHSRPYDDHRTAGTNPTRPTDNSHSRPPGTGSNDRRPRTTADNDHRPPGDGNGRTPPSRPPTRHDDPPSRPRPDYGSGGDSGHRGGSSHGGGTAYNPPPPPPPPPARDPEPAANLSRDSKVWPVSEITAAK